MLKVNIHNNALLCYSYSFDSDLNATEYARSIQEEFQQNQKDPKYYIACYFRVWINEN